MFEFIGLLVVVVWLLKVAHTVPGVCSRRRSLPKTLGDKLVITGATDGIGRAYADLAAKNGIPILVLVGRNQEKLDAVKREVETKTTTVRTVQADFDSADLTKTAGFEELKRELSTAESLINCAGVSYPGAMYYEEVGVPFLDTLIRVNLMSTMIAAHLAYKGMRARGKGLLVFMGSASSLVAEPLLVGYAGTKGAIDGLGRSLQAECVSTEFGIQIQVPFMVTTKMSKIRKPSLLVPSADAYARAGLRAACHASNRTVNDSMRATICPYWSHQVILNVCQRLPRYLWEQFRLSEQKVLRKKYMAKVTKATTTA
ncbi:putative short chain dehydrogenase [Gregarina niphandrodes]|uniref:Short chain dehydrogenase n=1 Tax=Gregarina niphandrodes TaxID=110365 RepID=A0A023B5C7_GRENI|nr:putative short chain dehydrogenase [Gregarina niphandrodes]EZG60069.1 putative short chain dehydrogenase [Gregarina niphandrodes]|eukprot:XP_011130853.1 putative short chain dehydrogenase [Gregarina niphandrodes]